MNIISKKRKLVKKDKEEIKELRPKDVCEQQLAAELAVGAVDSIDSLIEQGHEVACEYACQLLFDNLREKVAKQSNLPVRIVQHLLKDRCENVRLTIIETNWNSLTKEQQEEFICEAEKHFSVDEKKKNSWSFRDNDKTRSIEYTIKTLLKAALKDRNESTALRYMKIYGLRGGLPIPKDELISTLKDMPEIFKVYWNNTSPYGRRIDLILANPDEEVRMKEIQKILAKETYIENLKDWRKVVGDTYNKLKTEILKLWVADPSEAIRKFIATTTTDVSILEMLSTDASKVISQIAYPRYVKFQKRAKYSKAYNKRKQEKLRQEEEVIYQRREAERGKERAAELKHPRSL